MIPNSAHPPTGVIPEGAKPVSGTHTCWAIRRDQVVMGPALPPLGNRDDSVGSGRDV